MGRFFFLLDDFVRRNGVGSDAEDVVVQHTIDPIFDHRCRPTQAPIFIKNAHFIQNDLGGDTLIPFKK